MNNTETTYVQIIKGMELTSLDGEVTKVFPQFAFYCLIEVHSSIELCNSCSGENDFQEVKYYIFEYNDKLFKVSEIDSLLRDDCPEIMDVYNYRFLKHSDETTHYVDAIKKLTGHTINQPSPVNRTINDILGIKKGGYAGTPIPGEDDPNKDKIK